MHPCAAPAPPEQVLAGAQRRHRGASHPTAGHRSPHEDRQLTFPSAGCKAERQKHAVLPARQPTSSGCLLGITELLLYPRRFARSCWQDLCRRDSRAGRCAWLGSGSNTAQAHELVFQGGFPTGRKKYTDFPLLQPRIGVVTGAKLLSFTAKSEFEVYRQEFLKGSVYFEKSHWLLIGFGHLRKNKSARWH